MFTWSQLKIFISFAEGWVQFCGIRLFVFRSSDDSTEDVPPLEDLLARPDAQQEEEDRIFNAKFEEEMRLRDLKKEEEEEYLRKKDEAKNKFEEDRKKYLQELDTNRRKLENGLTTEYIEAMVEQKVKDLEEIFSGKQPSTRHEAFHKDKNNSRQGLVRTNQSHMISDAQINKILDHIERKLNLTTKDEKDYAQKVLLPFLITACYADLHNISIAEAKRKIEDTLDEETVANICGLETDATSEGPEEGRVISTEGAAAVLSPDDDRGWRRRNR